LPKRVAKGIDFLWQPCAEYADGNKRGFDMTTLTQNFADTRYGALTDFIDAAKLAPRNSENLHLTEMADEPGGMNGTDWAGAINTADAVAQLTAPYADGAAIISRIEKAAGSIKLPPQMDTRRRRVRGDQGDELDIHAVWRGQSATAWARMGKRQVTSPPLVSIVINSIIQWYDAKTVISYRGAVGIVLCQLLEKFGYRVRLVVARGGRTDSSSEERFSCRTTIKDYGKPLDRETVACATHPAMQRILGIRWSWVHMEGEGTTSGNIPGEAIKEANEIFISKEVTCERSAVARIQAIIKDLTKAK
jgi:hypothetical protein